MEKNIKHMTEEELEKLRRKARLWTYITYILSVCVLIAALPLGYKVLEDEPRMALRIIETIIGAAVIGCGALGLFWMILAKSSYNRFDKAFKNQYVLSLIQTQPGFTDLRYVREAGFNWDEIRNAAVVACGDKKYFTSEDLLMGNYEGIPFKFSDVTTQRLVYRNKKNRVEEIFSGQVLGFKQYNKLKESDGHLQIFQKEFLSNIKGWTAEHKIETDNALFNKKFQIYAADEHNAYYILTPQVMEKIIAFSEAIDEQIAITFRNDYMFIAICRTRSMFNPYVDKPVSQQTALILEDISILQKAKEILI